MQKIIHRSLLARNQALKRQRRQDDSKIRQEMRDIRHEKVFLARTERSRIKEERKNRREDWMLGPLAPNRTAGNDGGSYGMIHMQCLQAPSVLKSKRERYFNFAVNDRVVVVKGREMGKIGQVRAVDEERQTVEIRGINMVDAKLPRSMRTQSASEIPYRPIPVAMSIQDIRLVIPLQDDVTGRVKDVVIDHLSGGPPFLKPGYGYSTPEHTRRIDGLDIKIPWPESDAKEFQTEEADTRRIYVEPKSFYLTMNHVPIPNTVVDELRNKYSKTRKVYEQEYIVRKMKEDAEEHWKKTRRLVSPQHEYWENRVKQKKQIQGLPRMTGETMRLIRDMQATSLGNPSGKAAE